MFNQAHGQTSPTLTLLGKSRWLRSNAKDVRVTKAMGSVSLAFACCVSARFSARYRVNQQSHGFLYIRAE